MPTTISTDYLTEIITNTYGDQAFYGCCLNEAEGGVVHNIWFAPNRSSSFVKINILTEEATEIPHTYSIDYAFNGCCFDGTYIWFSPSYSKKFVKINATTNEIIEITDNTYGHFAFNGCCFDGDNVWFSPNCSSKFIKINIITHTITEIENTYGSDFDFADCCHINDHVWFSPANCSKFIKINTITNAITEIENIYKPEYGRSFNGCCHDFDGYVWFSPEFSGYFIKIDSETNLITEIKNTYGTFGSCCSTFGYIWFAPTVASNFIKINATTNIVIDIEIPNVYGFYAFFGCCYDESINSPSVWFSPFDSNKFIKITEGITEIIPETITRIPTDKTFTEIGLFNYCCSDGTHIWFCPNDPNNSNAFVKINITTNIKTEIQIPSSYQMPSEKDLYPFFNGCCFDGTYVWFAPHALFNFIKINISTNEITEIINNDNLNSFSGCCFDGTSVWFAPGSSSNYKIIKINTTTNIKTEIIAPYLEYGNLFAGCCYDNAGYVWFAPYTYEKFIKINISTNEVIEIADNNYSVEGIFAPAFSGCCSIISAYDNDRVGVCIRCGCVNTPSR